MGAGPAFDRPDPAQLKACVHCGFCLPACPTYVLWAEEMDSPRGRIHLLKQASEGAPLGPALVRHLDACLGCLACVPACPSGVRYDRLLEAARAQVERRHRRGWSERAFRGALFLFLPHPARLRWARAGLRLLEALSLRRLLRPLRRRLPATLQALEALAPEATMAEAVPEHTPAQGPARRRVGLLTGCVQRVFFSPVNAATARVLAAEGCEVLAPRDQGCCGALSLHAGRDEEARALARRLIRSFEALGVDTLTVNAAGCGATLKDYGHLLRDDPAWAERARRFAVQVRDVSQLLAGLPARAPRHPLKVVAAWHDACHLAQAQGIRAEPRALLRGIPGLELRELAEPDLCCGSAGIYNLVEPEPARELGNRKADHVAASGAELVVTANPGCALQLRAALERRGVPLPVVHLMSVLDAALRGLPGEALGVGHAAGRAADAPGP
jgi:glycolate oxidase iron-sulfur subunit